MYTIAFNKWDGFIFYFLTGQCCGIYYFIIVYIQLTILVPWISKLIQSKYWKLGFFVTPISIIIEYIYILTGNSIIFPFNGLFFVIWFIFFYLGMCIRNNKIKILINMEKCIFLFIIVYMIQVIETFLWYYGGYAIATSQIKLSVVLYSIVISIMSYSWIIKKDTSIICFNKISKFFIIVGNYSFGIYLTHIALMAILNKTVYKFIDINLPFNVVLIILIEVIGISLMVKFCGKKVCKYLGLI